ncbi:MAG: LacI family transcriptional regulator [Rhodothermia bacterium]|nr:LacI family transcriptional regulator [Rhodothermia bacterium]
MNDIATKAGVSVSTASRVLNNKASEYRISEDTETLVRKVAQDLGYRPNHVARGLRLQTTNTVGLVAPDISNPFFASIVKRVQTVAHDLGYSLVVCNTNEDSELEEEHLNLLDRKRVDGLIAMPVGQDSSEYHAWIETGVPLVLVDRCFDDLDVPSVVVDNYAGAYQATSFLADSGHRRIAFIQGLPGTYTNSERLRGYRDALHDHELYQDDRLVVGGDFREENGYIETKLLLGLDDRPTVIFASSDLITLGALKAIYEDGLEIPRDLSLLSFDDFDFAPFLKCPLTVVRQPRELMGEVAMKLLAQQLENASAEKKRVVLRPEFILRDSVAPVNVEPASETT